MKKNKPGFRLLVITDRKRAKSDLEKVVMDLCKNGVKAIQLREKDLPAVRLLKLCKEIKSITGKSRTKLIVNDRLDIALLCNADGLHSPEKGIDAKNIKKYNKNFIAGKSVHSLTQALKAEKSGFDYLLFGPVFRTASKIKYGEPQGLAKLKKVCDSVNIPVFAVGGITPERINKCMNAGAFGVAAITPFMKSGNIKKTVNEFKSQLGKL